MKKIRVMIVDDEARIRRGIERLVHSCGDDWEVVATASDGREALEVLHQIQGRIDLLITDVKMPEMDGLTLIKEAKIHYSFYPLLISGYDDYAYLQTALREGALDYLLKPVDREQFRLRMAEIRTIISKGRYQSHKREELERESEKLKKTRLTQTLSYITSMGIDMTTLGYWVDEFPRGAYVLLSIRLDTLPVKTRSYKPSDWKAYYYILENIISELLDNQFQHTDRQGWCWRGGESDFWMLLFSPDSDFDWEICAHELALKLRSAIQTYTPFSVSIAFGNAIEDLYLLPEAKRQATALMNYRFLSGGNQVFRPTNEAGNIQEVKPLHSIDRNLSAIAQRLKRSVLQGNSEEAEESLRQFCEQLDRLDSPSLLRKTVQNAIVLVHSAELESRCGLTNEVPLEDVLNKVERSTSLQELKQCVKQLTDRVVGDIRKARASSNMKPVEQARNWIQDNLDQEITIKKIADQVYMNPTYFSEYFKMQTGETILDYLTRQRMDRAKALLVDQRLKLQAICGRVGYQDVKYFSRLFKQWTGQTPSKFREQFIIQRGDESNGGE